MAVFKAPRYLGSFASSAKEALNSGAIHIKIVPRPRNLGESREVLRVLEKYGEVVMFKHLKYEPQAPAPNSILAIYKSPSSAQRLIGASPLRLRLQLKDTGWQYHVSESENRQEKEADEIDNGKAGVDGSSVREAPDRAARDIPTKHSSFQGLGGSQKWGSRGPSINDKASTVGKSPPPTSISATGSVASPPDLPATKPYASKGPPPRRPSASQYREFEMKITPSNTNHNAYIERQGYYGPSIPNKQTIMAQDLEGRVPLEGLLDCQLEKTEVPLRIRIKWTEKGTLTPFSLKALYEETNASKDMT